MSWNRFLKLNAVLSLLLGLLKISFGQECDTNGINCISCTEYRTCTGGIPQGGIISCKRGNVCADGKLKQCQLKLNCEALNKCRKAGIFPDVMVDSNYFICAGDGSGGFLKRNFTCQEGRFFEASTISCIPRNTTSVHPDTNNDTTSSSISSLDKTTHSDNITAAMVTTSSPETTTSPGTASSPENNLETPDPTSFTTMSSLYESSSSVTNFRDPISVSSVHSDFPFSGTTTLSYFTSHTGPSYPISSNTTSTPEIVCPGSGIFSSPDNCKIYYRCSTSLKLSLHICPGKTYFNENILKCSLVITPACQEQILRNSSSTTFVTTFPLHTTPSSPTTPTPQFVCRRPGIFPNPDNCKMYYRCSTFLKLSVHYCPEGLYFNENVSTCTWVLSDACSEQFWADLFPDFLR